MSLNIVFKHLQRFFFFFLVRETEAGLTLRFCLEQQQVGNTGAGLLERCHLNAITC